MRAAAFHSEDSENGAENPFEVIARAFQEALNREHEYVTLEHILRVMLDEEEIKDVLTELELDVALLKDEIDQWLRSFDRLTNCLTETLLFPLSQM